jgi:hypothetical protein
MRQERLDPSECLPGVAVAGPETIMAAAVPASTVAVTTKDATILQRIRVPISPGCIPG